MAARGSIIGALLNGMIAMITPWRERQRPDPAAEWYEHYNVGWSMRLRLRLSPFGNASSYNRGLILLLQNLSPSQRQEFLSCGHFHVVGGQTKRRYRISKGRQLNVHQLDDRNRRVCIWCFYPAGNLVDGDVMLAQKLAIELFEDEALTVANRLSNYFEPIGP